MKYERRFLLSNDISLCQRAVICICETWLNKKISDSELLLNDYLTFRSDRKSTEDKNSHGGTLIAIQRALNCRQLVLDDVDSCAICETQVNQNIKFFCSFYKPLRPAPVDTQSTTLRKFGLAPKRQHSLRLWRLDLPQNGLHELDQY